MTECPHSEYVCPNNHEVPRVVAVPCLDPDCGAAVVYEPTARGLSRMNNIRIPEPGTVVRIYPSGQSEPWEASIVSYTPDGRLRVRSTREGATMIQTLTLDTIVKETTE